MNDQPSMAINPNTLSPNILDMFHGDNREHIPDFKALAQIGVWGVIHKATQGCKYTDPKCADRLKAAHDAGLLIGTYHFMDSTDAQEQGDWYMNAVSKMSVDVAGTDLLFAADYEKSGSAASTPSLRQLGDFVSFVDSGGPSGTAAVIYSGDLIRETLKENAGGHQNQDMLGVEKFFVQHRLWLAEYGPHENIPWPWKDVWKTAWLWQFKDTGRLPPIMGNVDLNFYAGSHEQLAAEWKAGPTGSTGIANLQNLGSRRGQMLPPDSAMGGAGAKAST